jgi:hypothetical protein
MLSAQKGNHEPLNHARFKFRDFGYDLQNHSLNGLSGAGEGIEYDTSVDWVTVQSGWKIPWATLEMINEFNAEWGVESKVMKIGNLLK